MGLTFVIDEFFETFFSGEGSGGLRNLHFNFSNTIHIQVFLIETGGT